VILTGRDCFQFCGLADLHGFEYTRVGEHYGKSLVLKIGGTLYRSFQLLTNIFGAHVDLALSHGSRSQLIEKIAKNSAHQALHFHNVGKSDLKDRLQKIIKGVSLNVGLSTFREILDCLAEKMDILWVAPLIDILKYENEYKYSNIEVLKYHEKQIEMNLRINTDMVLYNHPLTLIVPITNSRYPERIFQNDVCIQGYTAVSSDIRLFNIKPIDSRITVIYQPKIEVSKY